MAGRDMKLSKKYLWSFFVVVLVIDLFISSSLFILYSSSKIMTAEQSSVAQLEQACSATDILYESLEAIVNQVRTDPEAVYFFLSDKTDRLREADLGIRLRSIRTSNPYLRYITLYSSSRDRFVSTAYAGEGFQLAPEELLNSLENRPYSCIFHTIGADYNVQESKTEKVYSFIFPVRLQTGSAVDMIILDVNETYFSKALSPILSDNWLHYIFLQDDSGQPIASLSANPSDTFFSTSNLLFPAFQDSRIANENSGSFSHRDKDGFWFVSFAKAPNAGWTIYSLIPYSAVLSGLGILTGLTLALTLVTLIFGYTLSKYVSQFLYRPIHSLYEDYVDSVAVGSGHNELGLLRQAFSQMYSKVDQLEQGLIDSYRESKNLYLRRLLSGENEKVRSALSVYQQLEIDLSAPYFAVLILDCVPSAAYKETDSSEEDLFICYYALENITREMLSSARGVEFIRMSENRFLALLYLENQLGSQELSSPLWDGLNLVAQTMTKEFQLDVSICVSSIVDTWPNINLAYEQARIASDSLSIQQYGNVFYSWNTPQTIDSSFYYNDLHLRLAGYVREEKTDAFQIEFDLVLAAMKNVSFPAAKTYFRHVLLSVLDSFSPSLKKNSLFFNQLLEQIKKTDDCRNVQQLRSAVLDVLSSLSHFLSDIRKNSNQDAALQAKAYIDANFANPELSLRMLADQAGLSPAYLGKMFTTVTTFSFNDYLNRIRITKAAELLRSSKQPISKISEDVGILNTNYFYSLFKKQYGVTPSVYRKSAGDDESHS